MERNNRKRQIIAGMLMLILGIAIAVYSIVLYQKIARSEAQGLNFRFHWFFFAVYKLAGKTLVCGLLLSIGVGIIVAGIVKCRGKSRTLRTGAEINIEQNMQHYNSFAELIKNSKTLHYPGRIYMQGAEWNNMTGSQFWVLSSGEAKEQELVSTEYGDIPEPHQSCYSFPLTNPIDKRICNAL